MSHDSTGRPARPSRREWLTATGMFAALALPSTARALTRAPKLVTKRNPGCSCCEGWATHMRAAGFEIDMSDHPKLNEYKDSLGVPGDLRGCHTSVGEGYIFEGHIPAPVVQRFLKEKPSAKGIAVAGMPAGSPGMESPDPVAYDVVAFDGTKTWVYEKIAAG